MKNINLKNYFLTSGFVILAACSPQYTPPMMNNSQIQLSRSTMMEQIDLADINDGLLSALADHYSKKGSGVLDLTMTYDPASKNFTAMDAVHKLNGVKASLKKKNITNIKMQTMSIPNGKASLLVSYDIVEALSPSECQTTMPGVDTRSTTRFMGEYKFGCSVDTIISRQIAHPSDLEGTSGLGQREGRRDAAILDGYNKGVPREPIQGIERQDLQSE